MGLLFLRNTWVLVTNVTTIEGWEIERHEELIQRARRNGGYLNGPDGYQLHLTRQEYPYDIGIFANIAQGMTAPIVFWLLPFAPTAANETGLHFQTNGFDGMTTTLICQPELTGSIDRPWPPPDPDRIQRKSLRIREPLGILADDDQMTPSARVEAFRQRQIKDIERRKHQNHEEELDIASKSWANAEGERLEDFGVDDEDEDDIPLSELMQRRKQV